MNTESMVTVLRLGLVVALASLLFGADQPGNQALPSTSPAGEDPTTSQAASTMPAAFDLRLLARLGSEPRPLVAGLMKAGVSQFEIETFSHSMAHTRPALGGVPPEERIEVICKNGTLSEVRVNEGIDVRAGPPPAAVLEGLRRGLEERLEKVRFKEHPGAGETSEGFLATRDDDRAFVVMLPEPGDKSDLLCRMLWVPLSATTRVGVGPQTAAADSRPGPPMLPELGFPLLEYTCPERMASSCFNRYDWAVVSLLDQKLVLPGVGAVQCRLMFAHFDPKAGLTTSALKFETPECSMDAQEQVYELCKGLGKHEETIRSDFRRLDVRLDLPDESKKAKVEVQIETWPGAQPGEPDEGPTESVLRIAFKPAEDPAPTTKPAR